MSVYHRWYTQPEKFNVHHRWHGTY